MSGARENTLVVDLSVLPIRPEIAKVQQFLEHELKLQYADIKSIQLHHSRNCVYIEMKSREIAARYQLEHNWKRTMLCGNAKFRIPVYVDCDAVTVRVHDLPPSMSPVTIVDHMIKYGEVISIRNEKWKHYFPGISNGVRVLRMNLLRQIPSFITVEGHETMVSYIDQPKSCRQCNQPSHPGKKCPDLSTAANQTPSTSSLSKSTDGLFTQDDFPSINDKRQKSPSPVRVNETEAPKQQNNDDDWTEDDNGSSSSTEHNQTTNKRRRSRRNKEDGGLKKTCSNQCSPNTDHTETVLSSDEKTSSSKTKSFNIVNKK